MFAEGDICGGVTVLGILGTVRHAKPPSEHSRSLPLGRKHNTCPFWHADGVDMQGSAATNPGRQKMAREPTVSVYVDIFTAPFIYGLGEKECVTVHITGWTYINP
jgi:hypothetical protein